MKQKLSALTFAIAAASLLTSGCASSNVNPPTPRSQTGYVDFSTDFSGNLSWDVRRFDEKANDFKKVFYEFSPLRERILRLAFVPGSYKFRVTFLNHAIEEPVDFEVEVRESLVTPVQIKVKNTGMVSVQDRDTSVGGTVYGRYGRRTKIGSEENVSYDISAIVGTPVPYQLKEQMSYAR